MEQAISMVFISGLLVGIVRMESVPSDSTRPVAGSREKNGNYLQQQGHSLIVAVVTTPQIYRELVIVRRDGATREE